MVSNHDELMSNFFAQADALAVGKSPVELRSENVPDALIPHKTFTGNRPSSSLMLPDLSAYTTGQILSLYEHITAVQVRSSMLQKAQVLGTLSGSQTADCTDTHSLFGFYISSSSLFAPQCV